jgi:HK97 gp10 family phage protein
MTRVDRRDVIEALRAIPDDLARDKGALRFAMYGAAALIRDEARARAPEDTGRLKRSLIVVARRGRGVRRGVIAYRVTHRRGRRSGRERGRQWVEAYSRLDAYYAPWVEYGTAKMAARPFMRPALAARADDAVKLAAERLRGYLSRPRRRVS